MSDIIPITSTIPLDEAGQNFIDTVCYQCIFAQWEDNDQVGCHANMLDKHQDKEFVEFADSGKSCWLLNNMACLYYRSPMWIEMQQVDNNLTTIHDFLLQARKEMALRTDAIIIVKPGDTIEQVEVTVKSLENMVIKPKKIYIANCKAIRPSELILWAQHHINLPWHIEYFLVETPTNEAIDSIVNQKCESIYLIVFRAGYIPTIDILQKLDHQLYDEMEKFVLATPIESSSNPLVFTIDTQSEEDINGLFCMRIAFKNLGGNGKLGIVEKVRILCEEQKCPTLMRKMSQLLVS